MGRVGRSGKKWEGQDDGKGDGKEGVLEGKVVKGGLVSWIAKGGWWWCLGMRMGCGECGLGYEVVMVLVVFVVSVVDDNESSLGFKVLMALLVVRASVCDVIDVLMPVDACPVDGCAVLCCCSCVITVVDQMQYHRQNHNQYQYHRHKVITVQYIKQYHTQYRVPYQRAVK